MKLTETERAIADAMNSELPAHWKAALSAQEHPQTHAKNARLVADLLERRYNEIMEDIETWKMIQPLPRLHHPGK